MVAARRLGKLEIEGLPAEKTTLEGFIAQIEAVVDTHADVAPKVSSAWSSYMRVQGRAMAFDPPQDKAKARVLVKSLSRLSKWVGHPSAADVVAHSMLSRSLSMGEQYVTWARRLLEAYPKAGKACVEDMVLLRQMRAPEDPWLRDDWRWVVDKLMRQIIPPGADEGTFVLEHSPLNNANVLLRAAYLAKADGYAWTGKPDERMVLRWAAKAAQDYSLTHAEHEVIQTLMTVVNRAELDSVARRKPQSTPNKAVGIVRRTRI